VYPNGIGLSGSKLTTWQPGSEQRREPTFATRPSATFDSAIFPGPVELNAVEALPGGWPPTTCPGWMKALREAVAEFLQTAKASPTVPTDILRPRLAPAHLCHPTVWDPFWRPVVFSAAELETTTTIATRGANCNRPLIQYTFMYRHHSTHRGHAVYAYVLLNPTHGVHQSQEIMTSEVVGKTVLQP
jgi:hypothetical protein